MKWILNSDDQLLITMFSCLLMFIIIICITRVIGLRSFAKFTAYDFAFTIAIGSIISSILTSSTSLIKGSVAIIGLLTLTYIFSILQKKSERVKNLISNAPLLLMDGNQILYDNLDHARIEEHQLISKLREANVLHFDQVYAVVLESTGSISVLHKSNTEDKSALDSRVLSGVRKKP